MDTYKSDKQVIDCDIATVYGKLSNPAVFKQQLEQNIDKLPEEARAQLQNLKFEDDGVVIESPMGPLKMGIVEKVEPTKIVFGAAQSPVPFGLIVELKEMDADHNADMCLFLEQWEEMREDVRSYNCSPAALHSWQEQTLAYYAGASVECVEPEELDEDERLARRRAYLEKEFGSVE